MKPFLKLFLFVALAWTSNTGFAEPQDQESGLLKQQILELAQSYEGRADPDQSLQKNLEVLVDQLVARNPMPPVADRIPLLAGAWKQVWGPYDYRNDKGGIDPTLGRFEIYQVISKDGFYYNVAPLYPNSDTSVEQIGLLRGEYQLDPLNPNKLQVKFTDYPGLSERPLKLQLWELPALAEAGALPDLITIVPSDQVRRFFKGGSLDEVYTDENLRLLYGQMAPPSTRRFLYIMKRVSAPADLREKMPRVPIGPKFLL